MTLGSGQSLPVGEHEWPMGRWGRLVQDGDSLAVVNPHGGRRRLEALPRGMHNVTGWLDEPAGLLVVGAERADRVTVLDLSLDEVVQSVALRRDPDAGLRHMRFFALDDEAIGCLTEEELFALGGDGRLRWLHAHHDLSLSLQGVSQGVVRLAGLSPDLQDTAEVEIDAATGEVLPRPAA